MSVLVQTYEWHSSMPTGLSYWNIKFLEVGNNGGQHERIQGSNYECCEAKEDKAPHQPCTVNKISRDAVAEKLYYS